MVEHPVNQPDDGPNPHRVPVAPVPIQMRHRPEPAQLPDRVLHHDPTPAERAIVFPVRRRALLPARLAARTRAQPLRIQRTDPDVSQVPDLADPLRESPQQPGLLQQFDVRPTPRNRVRHVHEPTGGFAHGHLALV